MPVALPSSPLPRTAVPRYIEYGTQLRSNLGGSTQNIMRIGDRVALDVELPPMREVDARAWIAAQMRAKAEGQTVRTRVPQIPGPAGITFVGIANAVQGSIAGANAAQVAVGMWFSAIAANGYSYLHMVTTKVGATIGVAPRLRTNFNGAVIFDAPLIEGWLETPVQWSVEVAQIVGLSFTVAEGR